MNHLPLVAAAALFLLIHVSGCSARRSADVRCMPEEIDGVLVRIDRRAEAGAALALIHKLEARGMKDPVAAVYEFAFMRNKPVFHFVLGLGQSDRRLLLEEAVAEFGGRQRPGQTPAESTVEGVVFLCVGFDRGSGLVGLSGACAFTDGDLAGYGVRTDGGDATDALKYTAEARRIYLARSARHDPCDDVRHLSDRAKGPSDREGFAREVVAAIKGYDCEILAGFFPEGSEEYFREQVTPDLRGRKSPMEWVCFVLGTLGYPQSETMRIQAVDDGGDRVLLQVSESTDRAELALVRDGSTWKVDRQWALRQVFNHRVKLDLASLASTFQQYGPGSFSDDPEEVTRRTRIVVKFRRGLANSNSVLGEAYVSLGSGSQYACLTALSRSGEFLIVRVDKEGWTNGLLQTPPESCPDRPLEGSW